MTSAFDDDYSDYRPDFVNVNEFNEEDDDVAACWEDVLDEEEEKEKEKQQQEEEAKRKELEKEKRLQKREEERRKAEELVAVLNAKPMTKEEQERAQYESDMRNASDLFGDGEEQEVAAVVNTIRITSPLPVQYNAESIDTYVPVEAEDFDELRRRIVLKMENYQEDEGYHTFVKGLVQDLVSSMSSDDIKKISNPLVNIAHEKSREEKEAKKKAQSSKKTQLKVAKQNTNSNLMDDYIDDEYTGGFDDEYDFM